MQPRPAQNEPRDHHYTPQFYMRRFAPADDLNGVQALWRHEPFVLSGRRSIARIGFEEDLHTIVHRGGAVSLERLINEGIEAPLSRTETWRKVAQGDAKALCSPEDRLNLYVLARHLQARNLETLRFLEAERDRILQHGFPEDYSPQEREMYRAIMASPTGAKDYFLMMASDVRAFIWDLRDVGVHVMSSEVRLRTSTNPVLAVPTTRQGAPMMPEHGPGLQVHWLPLGPHLGAMITKAPGMAFLSHGELPRDTAIMLNRLYLMQLLEGLSVRYCFADDPYVDADLEWAGFGPPRLASRGAKYERLRPKTTTNWLDEAWARRAPR